MLDRPWGNKWILISSMSQSQPSVPSFTVSLFIFLWPHKQQDLPRLQAWGVHSISSRSTIKLHCLGTWMQGGLTTVAIFALDPRAASKGFASASFWFFKAVRNALVNEMTPATFGWDPGCDSPRFLSLSMENKVTRPETLSDDYDSQILCLPPCPSLTHVASETINEKLFSSGQKKKNGFCLWSLVNE